MPRVKRGVAAHRRHKKVLKAAKGYRGLRSKTFRQAKTAVMKAGVNAYRDRRLKKRTFRSVWITRINAACRAHGISYSRFMNGCLHADIGLDRKMLAELAVNNPDAFAAVVEKAKGAAVAK